MEKKRFKLKVTRPKNKINLLTISVDYHKNIIAVFKSFPKEVRNYRPAKKTWDFNIECSKELYEKLDRLNLSIDLSELKKWRDLVDGWDITYPPKPVKCRKFEPYPFQLKDIEKMLEEKCIINANEMGCGKTHESVCVGESLPMKKLVICPAILRLNWEREILMVNPNADIAIIYNDKDYVTGDDWTIIGYPSVEKFLDQLEEENFQCIFVDEAHYCQAINNSGSPNSKRAKGVLRLTATAGWVYPITGTPKTNRNKNLYNILRMVRHPNAKSEKGFFPYAHEFCDAQRNNFGWNFDGNSNDDKLHKLIRPYMIRHLKKEVLPDLRKQRISIPINIDLRNFYDKLAEYRKESNKANQIATLMKARQELAIQKVEKTIEFVNEVKQDGEKIVIVTCFRKTIEMFKEYYGDKAVIIQGGMTDKQKDAAIMQFQKGTPEVMLLNIVAGGVGITLTAANKMFINDYSFVPGEILQVEDRICRTGQTESCTIYYMTAIRAFVERHFVEMLTYKSDTINEVIDGGFGEGIDFQHLVDKMFERKKGGSYTYEYFN